MKKKCNKLYTDNYDMVVMRDACNILYATSCNFFDLISDVSRLSHLSMILFGHDQVRTACYIALQYANISTKMCYIYRV